MELATALHQSAQPNLVVEEPREEEVQEMHDDPRGLKTPPPGTAGAEYFTMSDDEAALLGGTKHFQGAPLPQVAAASRCSCAAAGGRTGPQSPRWVLPVDVPVPQVQETGVLGRPVQERLPWRCLKFRSLSRAGMISCCTRNDQSCFAFETGEVREQEEAQLLLHRDTDNVGRRM